MPREIPGELPPPATLLDIMRQDKKAQGGKLTFILARGIGEAFIAKDVADARRARFSDGGSSTAMSLDLGFTIAAILSCSFCLPSFPARETGLTAASRARLDRTRAARQRAGRDGAGADRDARAPHRRAASRQQRRQHLRLGAGDGGCSCASSATAAPVVATVAMTVLVADLRRSAAQDLCHRLSGPAWRWPVLPSSACWCAVFGPVVMTVEYIVKTVLRAVRRRDRQCAERARPRMMNCAAPSTSITRKAPSSRTTATCWAAFSRCRISKSPTSWSTAPR